MLQTSTQSTVTVGTSPVTLYSFSPSRNGGIRLMYSADSLGLTSRVGEFVCGWDLTDNITQDYDTSILDNVDYVTAPGACTGVDAGTGSTNTDGDHLLKVTFVTAAGETELGTASGTVTVTGNDDISVTAVPCSTDAAVTRRNIYMTEASGATYYLATYIDNNTGTTATIAISDTNLALSTAAPTANTSALADSSYLTLASSMSAGVVSITATSTSGTWTVRTVELGRI